MQLKLSEKGRIYFEMMRLDKPAGLFLLLSPCFFTLAIEFASFYYYLLFALGAFFMRPAGCIINDLFDREYDKDVERTKNRPIASGRVSTKEALIFLFCLLVPSFIILMQFNLYTIILTLCSIPLIIIYPLMKRITFMPQLFLAIVFNFGALVAGSAVKGSVSVIHIMTYMGCMFWTLGYDTIYAYQDIKDDEEVGVRSSALLFGDAGKWWVSNFYRLAALFLLSAILFASSSMNWLFVLLFGLASYLLYWQVNTLDLENSENCKKRFDSNMYFGLLITLAFIFIRVNIKII